MKRIIITFLLLFQVYQLTGSSASLQPKSYLKKEPVIPTYEIKFTGNVAYNSYGASSLDGYPIKTQNDIMFPNNALEENGYFLPMH